ncbi:Hsp70 family protein [Vibrio algicola]|uniref:Hsp70 family protein n=1 Tax=Vibrio algicola TaxID=2662262 RepID=A0A5Q0TDD2_9VIBR|nr:Hsp70 family protein [Vibrio algicola]
MSSSSRTTKAHYLIGIDLGTTNSVLAYCEIQDDLTHSPVAIFDIDQLVGPGEVTRKPLLPSFRFHPANNQFQAHDLTLPWENQSVSGDLPQAIIGEWARELGEKVEGRQVSSAKSWLSHDAVDRGSDILPWSSGDDVEKVSPVVASASYLNHIRQSWNHHHPIHRLEQQEVVITIPASFDESARNLTLQAAKLAGLPHVHLLEEPQAVCYDWYSRHLDSASDQLANIPSILVCDVGGGTTDLSLISATYTDGNLNLNRIGVGDHLMLGGDNIDLALAHLAEQRLADMGSNSSKKLNAASLMKLIQQTRKVKEDLLRPDAPEQAKISVLGSGSRLIGGTKSAPISKQEIHQIVLDGFFPLTEKEEISQKRRTAMVEFGLPYAADAAVSRHIAEFIQNHSPDKQIPSGLLLNGGVFNSELVENRMVDLLSQWQGSPITLLDNPSPDLSVAFGAVAYAKARRGAQLKIGGGSARSYFLHLKHKKKSSQALCLLAKGTEAGQEIRLTGRKFLLTLGEPIQIDMLTSTQEQFIDDANRLTHPQNSLLLSVDRNIDQAVFRPLPPYIATLDSQTSRETLQANQKDRVEVMLACQLTEVGTLKLECVSLEDDSQRWLLEFDTRKHEEFEQAQAHPRLEAAQVLISSAYSANKKVDNPKLIKTLSKDLEKQLSKRENWDFPTLRQLFDSFALGKKRRRRSADHEKQWLRLAGFCLRPGFGDPTDEWRCEQTWALYQQGIQFPSSQTWSDWWIFWRRIAGGLHQEQQETILADIAKYLHPGAHRAKGASKEVSEHGYEAMVRLSASLEHLDSEDKILLATWFFNRAQKSTDFIQAHWWAVARLASRSQLYGSQHNIIPAAQVSQWLLKMLELDWKQEPTIAFAAVMMARKTGDRSLDIADDIRVALIEKLKANRASQSWVDLVSEVTQLSSDESKKIFGDSIPAGIILL